MGLNYVAATQDVEVTRKRVSLAAACWVACCEPDDAAGRLGAGPAGTICYYSRSRGETSPAFYARPEVGHFGQFAVEPRLQGRGVGAALLRVVEEHAIANGKTTLACDTAEPAKHLLEYYAKRGFSMVGRHRWPHARYDSLILSKMLRSS